jgi:hypothetical protein
MKNIQLKKLLKTKQSQLRLTYQTRDSVHKMRIIP